MDKACLLAISLFQALNREQLRELKTILKIVNYSYIAIFQRKLFIGMPPVRRRNAKRHSTRESSSNTNPVDGNTDSLRRQCAEKGLTSSGRRNVLISRLQRHAASANTTVAAENIPSTSTSPQPDDQSPPPFSEEHLAQIQSIVTQSIEQSVTVIATNAARAAVEAMSSTPQQSHENRSPVDIVETAVSTTNSSLPSATSVTSQPSGSNPGLTTVPYGNGFHEVPAPYIKRIQAGEFFDLSKLLPKNMSTNNLSEDAIVLTLENSVIKANKASQPTAKITNIEQ